MLVVYFFSIDIFNQKGFWKMIFELRIKANVSTKCIYKCIRLAFWYLPCINFAGLYFAFCSWHITILFPHYFWQSLDFSNHFAELEIVLFEVELIISNPPLKYVYPNTKETCLSSNHLLFDRQLLYSSNTTLTAATNLTILSSTTD